MTPDLLMAECRSDRGKFRRVCKDYLEADDTLTQGVEGVDEIKSVSYKAGFTIAKIRSAEIELQKLREAVQATHDEGNCECSEDWTGDFRRVVTVGALCTAAGIEDA